METTKIEEENDEIPSPINQETASILAGTTQQFMSLLVSTGRLPNPITVQSLMLYLRRAITPTDILEAQEFAQAKREWKANKMKWKAHNTKRGLSI